MSYRKLAIIILALAFLFPQNILCQKLKLADNRPNVLVVTIDTLRADRVRCYGYTKISTPIMDQLSREGVLFEDVSCAVPLTLPSHASIFTGLYPFNHGMRSNLSFIKDWNKLTLAEVLRQQGYKTAAFLGSSILDSSLGLDRGFEVYNDNFAVASGELREIYAEKKAEAVAQPALEWLQRNKEEKFFLWIHFFDPHDPYTPPEPFKSQYPGHPYDGEVAYADSVLGEVVTRLKQWQLYSSTLIIVTSDHGEGLGDHKEQDHGYFIYESTLRVPLFIYWQGKVPSGKSVKVPIRLIDIMPTVLDLLDIPLKATTDGRSFKSLVLSKRSKDYNSKGEPSYAESYYARLMLNWSELRGLREGNWKYIDAPKPELYNLSTDPKELKNLYQSKKDIALKLKAKLERIAGGEKAALSKQQPQPDPELLAKLESLGYIGAVHPKAAERGGMKRPDPKDKIDLWNKIFCAKDLIRTKRIPEAIQNFQQLLQEDPENLMVMENLGKCYYLITEYDRALEILQKTIGIVRKVYGEEHPYAANAYHRIGMIYDRKGRYSQALEFYQKALNIRTKLLGEEHHSTAAAYNDIGLVYQSKGELEKALQFHQKSLDIWLKSYGEEHPDTATTYNSLGMLYIKKKDYDRALDFFHKSLQIMLKYYGEEHTSIATCYNNIGQSYQRKGDYDKALQFHQKALDIWLKSYGEEHPATAISYNNIGGVYLFKGEFEKALHYAKKAFAIFNKTLGPEHPNTKTVVEIIKFIEKKLSQ